jgi:F-type H+-transporting ATPase subunit delta
MQNPRLAARYAKSLLDLAVEQNSLDTTLSDIKLLEAISRESRDFTNMLRSPVIKADKKQSIINAVLAGKLHPLVQAFVKLLVSKGREGNLPEIATAFINQYKYMKNIKTVEVTTAVPMSDSLRQSIRSKVMASATGSEIELKEQVDPSILGGFVLQMDDKLFDASIRRDLHDVKSQFLKNIYVSQV